MFPVWFFIVLLAVIGYLLYITRPSEDNFVMISKKGLNKLSYWFKRN
ncbi:MAG: hypothetical protein JWP88_1388 [Flaviaesturariibacter sp.]|nr:hypothetical protein [Flaviaesturariibacter sp.]